MSGGSGSRLWPLSTPEMPKQLHALVGEWTMIQATVARVDGVAGSTAPLVVCNAFQADEIERQLEEVGQPPLGVVIEPAGRNTAPAVAAAAAVLDPDTVMVVLPADHVVTDPLAFLAALDMAIASAREGRIVTFGVTPTRPETGFGYIESEPALGSATEVIRFVEKPDKATAISYVESGRFLWNSGMFVFTAGSIRSEIERLVPSLTRGVEEAVDQARRVGRRLYLGDSFAGAEAVSIDHAVMEQTDRAVVVVLEAGWSDVGSWQALWEVISPDEGTVEIGEVHVVDVNRSYIRAGSRPVAVIGLDDVVVVDTPHALLVASRERAQDVRAAAEWFASLPRSDPPEK